jgi:hypothetical protein
MRAIALLLIILFIHCSTALSEIINGHSAKLTQARSAITNLEKLLPDLSGQELRKIRRSIKKLQATEKQLAIYGEKTDALLRKLQILDPVLYWEINTIRDAAGNPTDVYVKVVCNSTLYHGAASTTNVHQHPDNPHVYLSDYGPNTVCVQVCEKRNMLRNLVHEFGHVRYQVPNLCSYMKYYEEQYGKKFTDKHGYCIGHKPQDPSHQSVRFVLKRFCGRLDGEIITPFAKSSKISSSDH